MEGSCAGSIARCKIARPSDSVSNDDTVPTCTPRSSTFASGFITRPAREANTVTGTVGVNPPWKSTATSATISPIATTVNSPASGLSAGTGMIPCRIPLCRPTILPSRALQRLTPAGARHRKRPVRQLATIIDTSRCIPHDAENDEWFSASKIR